MRVLIVDDEIKTAAFLSKGLNEEGFSTTVANNGEEGLSLASQHDFDLVVLDVMMPGMDGWDVLKRLRTLKETPVLFVTARDRIEDRVKGLDLGADDYLVKPFAISELVARARSIIRRGKAQIVETLTIADLEVDPLKRRVVRGGERILLTAKEYALLLFFLRRQGEVLSRSLIAQQVWDMHYDTGTNVVDVAVRRLRAKIDDNFEHKLIHGVRGVGYLMSDKIIRAHDNPEQLARHD
ncbi:MAG: Transcriptional activator protein CzcR [Pseudomonadota bacterium]|jgi:two-component system copper resistance phosphate regulon response regulator CusR